MRWRVCHSSRFLCTYLLPELVEIRTTIIWPTPDLNATASYFHALEPGGVLAVDGAVASFGFLLAALSFIFSASLYFQVLPASHILVSVMLGTASMFSAMCCLTLLFQPKFSPTVMVACGVVCIVGYIKWPAGDFLSHWFFVCQVLIALVCDCVVRYCSNWRWPQALVDRQFDD